MFPSPVVWFLWWNSFSRSRGGKRGCNLCFQLQGYSISQIAHCILHLSVYAMCLNILLFHLSESGLGVRGDLNWLRLQFKQPLTEPEIWGFIYSFIACACVIHHILPSIWYAQPLWSLLLLSPLLTESKPATEMFRDKNSSSLVRILSPKNAQAGFDIGLNLTPESKPNHHYVMELWSYHW